MAKIQSSMSAVGKDENGRSFAAMADRALEAFGPYTVIGLILIAWEVTAQAGVIHPFLLPAFSTVVTRIFTDLMSGQLLFFAGLTLWRALTAFAIAGVVGIVLGVLMARVVPIRWFFDPIVSIGLPAPKIALLPVFMLWFGLYDLAKIMMVAFSASFQIIATTWGATRAVEKELIWSARSLGATEKELLWQVILPAALPRILTGLQIAMPICMIVVLVTEMVMGGQGLGSAMLKSSRSADSPGVFAGIIEIGLVGFIVIKSLEIIRRRLLVWHQETSH
jgi:taurine transport system permease protein